MSDSTNHQTVPDEARDDIALDDIGVGVADEGEEVEVHAFAAGVFEPPSKHARLEVLRVLGSRMREARELCRLPQNAAARQLGCETSRLARIESATDTNSVPLWLIRKAAERYEVSVDYLFGITDDWEVGTRMAQEREVSAWLAKAWNDARVHDVKARFQLEVRMSTIRETFDDFIGAARELDAALKRFAELTPEFDEDMRGGNRLANAVESVAIAATQANAKLARLGATTRAAA